MTGVGSLIAPSRGADGCKADIGVLRTDETGKLRLDVVPQVQSLVCGWAEMMNKRVGNRLIMPPVADVPVRVCFQVY